MPVRLEGYADRVEIDGDGGVVVVDFKTGRSKLSKPQVDGHRQLALYQLAVDSGAVDGLLDGVPGVAPGARSGGAELVQLGILDDNDSAVVQAQSPPSDDGPQRTQLRSELLRAADLLRREEFPAVAGQHCRDCSFVPLCPVKSAGPVTR